MRVQVRPATADRWSDLVRVFGRPGEDLRGAGVSRPDRDPPGKLSSPGEWIEFEVIVQSVVVALAHAVAAVLVGHFGAQRSRMLINGKLSNMTLHLIPGTVIERGEHWTIATNLNQNLIGRLIVVAARDADSVTALSPDEWQDLRRHIDRTRVALDALFQPDQYNYAFLMNQDTQVHLHVVPRYAQPRQWAGETYDDPHFGAIFGTEHRTLDTQRLANLADHVRQHLP